MDAAVIGAGPAGLMAAEVLAQGGARVTVFDAMPSAGRKFLMAGRGGLNLTHSEPLPAFLARYREAAPKLEPAISAFPPDRLRAWSEALGQKTFVGSSGRVFPESFKASPLLRAWLRRLDSQGVQFAFRHRWIGWDDRGALRFQTPEGERDDRSPRDRAGAWRRKLAAAWARMAHGPSCCRRRESRSRRCGRRIAASPSPGRMSSGIASKASRSRAPNSDSAIRPFAARPSSREPASRAARSMRCRRSLREAIAKSGEATLSIALRPDLSSRRSDQATVRAARQAVALQFPAQGGQSFAGCDRAVAGSGDCLRPAAGVALAGEACRTDQRRADQAHRRRADRAGDLDRGRYRFRRAR